MDIAVLMKAVPDLSKMRYDPDRKTMIREGAELFINPFDQRALRVALDLRRPGERVSVISMGPPQVGAGLREALALGADRAILVCDRSLAGSDTLVTARTLTRVLGQVGHGLVLTGRWTTDSETGQVGAEVAGLLGVPIASSARSLVRDGGGDGLDMVGDTETGWRRYRVSPPAVITIGEKIAKIRKPTTPELGLVPLERVETMTAADLGLETELVGLLGSPTVVASLANEEPARRPVVVPVGPPGTQVELALRALRPLLRHPRSPASPLPPLPLTLSDESEVLVLVTGPEGAIEPAALPILSEVRRALPGHWPSVVWAGSAALPGESLALARAGAWRGYRLDFPPGPASSRRVALALQDLIDEHRRAAAVIFLADTFGREVAGQLASRLSLGLTGDAVSMRAEPDGRILWGKPAFGGGVVAQIFSKTRPSVVTVRAGAFAPAAPGGPNSEPLIWEEREVVSVPVGVEPLESGRELVDELGDLDTAHVVVSVGMGIGSPENIAKLRPLLERWGAALAATRRVVDAGWVPRQIQVGLTGRSLAPDLVVLLGVSGSPNQLVGWKRARTLLAVDVNPEAPVFRAVDVGIVGRWEDLLPVLADAVEPLARALSATPP